MLHSLLRWTGTLQCRIRRRALERQLMDAAAQLCDHPESRCFYQSLLDEHMRLVRTGPSRSGEHPRLP